MCVVLVKVDRDEFEYEEKTGKGSSIVRHFDEKTLKTAEIRRKSVRVSRIRGPLELGGLGDAPRSLVQLQIRRVYCTFYTREF